VLFAVIKSISRGKKENKSWYVWVLVVTLAHTTPFYVRACVLLDLFSDLFSRGLMCLFFY